MMKKYIPIFLIFLLALIVITWSKDSHILSLGDYTFPQDQIKAFYKMLYTWDSSTLGISTFMIILSLPLPYGLYLALTHYINVSPEYSQIVWNYLLFASLGLSMYFLVVQLVHDGTKYVSGLLSAFFFMLNPWGALNLVMLIPFITFIPFILGLYIRGLHDNKGLKYIIYISVIWFLISSFSLWNIRGFIFQWIMLLFYLCYFCIKFKKKTKYALLFTLALLVIYILLNSYWLILLILNISKSISEATANYNTINYTRLDSYYINSSTTSLTLQLLANGPLTASFKGFLYFPWLSFYQKSLVTLLSFFPALTVVFSLYYYVKKNPKNYSDFFFFIFLFVFGIFITMGKNNLLNMWIATHVPLFPAFFSSPALHGGIFVVISYSVLIGYGFTFITHNIKSLKIKGSIFVLFIAMILIYGYPILTGQFILSDNKLLGAGNFQIPSYLYTVEDFLKMDKLHYRILPFPYSKIGYFAYNWPSGNFSGIDPLLSLLSKSQVMGTGIGLQLVDTISKDIDITTFFRYASLLNVKYVMIKRDANLLHIKNNSWYTVPDQTFLNSFYHNPDNISTFGQIDLIKIPDELFLPKLYTPLKVIGAENVNELPKIVSQNDYVTRSAIYVGNHPNILNSPNIPKTILEYRMISPVKYRVRIHNAKGLFPLIMSESFHEGWKAYLASPDNLKFQTSNFKLTSNIQGTIQDDNLPSGSIYEAWFKKPIIDDESHIIVNGYANSWIIDTNKICMSNKKCIRNADGSYDFELIIEFWNQRLYVFCLIISGCTLLLSLAYIKFKK